VQRFVIKHSTVLSQSLHENMFSFKNSSKYLSLQNVHFFQNERLKKQKSNIHSNIYSIKNCSIKYATIENGFLEITIYQFVSVTF